MPSFLASIALPAVGIALGLTLFRTRLAAQLIYLLPGLRRLRQRADAADLADTLAMLLTAGERLPQVLRLTARSGLSRLQARQLDRAARRIADGAPPAEAIGGAGALGRLLESTVAVGVASGDLPGALRDVAEALRSWVRAREQLVQSTVWVLGMGAIATLIGWGLLIHYRALIRIPTLIIGGG